MFMAAPHSRGKVAVDKIFGAGGKAQQAIQKFGRAKVINGSQGVLLDESENFVCLPTVEKVLRSLSVTDMAAYAPIRGLPEFLNDVIDMTFGEYKPDAHIQSVATAGGAGALHHTIWNYSSVGDTILTTDWFWTPYRSLCKEALRELDTFALVDADMNFDLQSFRQKAAEILSRQDNLMVIFNTPAHNPTGYSMSGKDWDAVLGICRDYAAQEKRVTLLIDAAYLDFADDKNSRAFFKKFEHLPANILVVVAVSMSKSFTLYGQRVGAMIGISSDQQVMEEFTNANEYTSRATWSNINRGAMKTLSTIYRDKSLLAALEEERAAYVRIIKERAQIVIREAAQVQLNMLPYLAGFFLSIPSRQPDAICDKLNEQNIFLVPLEKGVRIAVCSIPSAKMPGLASAIKEVMTQMGE